VDEWLIVFCLLFLECITPIWFELLINKFLFRKFIIINDLWPSILCLFWDYKLLSILLVFSCFVNSGQLLLTECSVKNYKYLQIFVIVERILKCIVHDFSSQSKLLQKWLIVLPCNLINVAQQCLLFEDCWHFEF